ncbi:anaphase-promoting complex subunit 2 [Pochonia chlamydosporia 170]|uniref:Anaphase-promoting complex subunit 2 n=1 Tax=Pochonia chlamydosporia 170 TaxID=1380566 RepID=A0A179G5N1_METCM|nr:anaphase-promoting complex subunit 2 [Pochonia chlamydosporia 170]OAQ72691.2 anaphase-promoting complex subunit 2 [Pochonia chlamydosporia 170]
MTASRVRTRKNKVLRSVFQTDVSQPTPLLLSTAPGEAFGGPLPSTSSTNTTKSASSSTTRHAATISSLQPASDQVRWDRAWHTVTSRIQLPTSVAVEDSFGTMAPQSQDADTSFYESLALVLDAPAALSRATHTEDILVWHTQQVRQHFVHHVLPLLAACAVQGDHAQVLLSSVQTLEAAHRQYLYGLTLIVRGIADDTSRSLAEFKFKRDLHAIIGNPWAKGLTDALRSVLSRLLAVILGSNRDNLSSEAGAGAGKLREQRVDAARDELLGLLDSMHNVGLSGDKFQVLFAEGMNECMNNFIRKTYAAVWTALDADGNVNPSASSGCMEHLCDWVENQYGRLAVEVFSRLGGQVAWTDVERWREIAIGRLASLRITELFDIVLHWPESKGGLEDLRAAVATPQRRLQLTDTFSATLQKRLLHPGRSTLDILQTYISMIRTFHQLDSSKVLLDRVVHALQLYLCQRDDAIRIVVTGLLSNPSTINTDEAKRRLVELAVLLNEASQQQRAHIEDEELDWDDMTWVPDPVDAGPNYKRPKNEDVIGTLINALGSQEIFIKEFQMIIAERLLSNQSGFQQEIKVLSLLKKRFGENALQNCDVMVKDIYDSKRVDALLRKNLRNTDSYQPSPINYHSKILSRLFWPSLPKDPFTVPAPVAAIQSRYEAGFEQLKTSRKLTWLNHIGTATVQLELEDRSVQQECKTYEAAVIYAFQGDATADNPQRTFNELWEKLMIDEDLLESALRFWISKRVLRDLGNQTYAVLEKLDQDDSTKPGGDTAAIDEIVESGHPPPRKPKMDPKEQERRTVYWQFIVGMLTNSSPAMPLGQIAMMMKMLIADGCSWSNEELQEFLGEKIGDGELELSGGKYRLVKK